MSDRRVLVGLLGAMSLGCMLLLGCHQSRRGGPSADAGHSAHAGDADANALVPGPGAAPTAPPAPSDPRDEQEARLAELSGAPLRDLEVEGFRAAVVAAPVGAREARPVVVALHGNYDRPEWQCEVWRRITGEHPWVLCPRGVPRGDAPKGADRWTYATRETLVKELTLALDALRAGYPAYVDVEHPVFAGFSLGAILGMHLLSNASGGPQYRAAVFIEGGYKGWSSATATAFAEQGGERVLFACGQAACRAASKQAVSILEKHNVLAETVSGGDVGHSYDGTVADAVAARWAWVVGDDERFASGRHEL